jgi:hypothetical protein
MPSCWQAQWPGRIHDAQQSRAGTAKWAVLAPVLIRYSPRAKAATFRSPRKEADDCPLKHVLAR